MAPTAARGAAARLLARILLLVVVVKGVVHAVALGLRSSNRFVL
jgi:hypothetical protein